MKVRGIIKAGSKQLPADLSLTATRCATVGTRRRVSPEPTSA